MSNHNLQLVTSLPRLPSRSPEGHKGTYGKVMVLAGSLGMSGAAVLAGSAALRGGAGLVRVAVADCILSIVASGNYCYTTIPLPSTPGGQVSLRAFNTLWNQVLDCDVLALGPGLGQSKELSLLLGKFLPRIPIPVVVDADGLNNCAHQLEALGSRHGPRIITPHPGEFAKLINKSTREVQAQRAELASEFARAHGMVIVLKGHETVVTDGKQLYVNSTGNPGMATGGTGDVLTGLLAALLGQGLDPFAAAQLAVHVHGLAGDLARDKLGALSLTAANVIEHLPYAFQQL